MASSAAVGLRPDRRMPDLDLLWSPARMIELLNTRVLPSLAESGIATGLTVKNLTYRPGRQCFALCELECGSSTADTIQLVISFAKDQRLEQAFRKRYLRRSRRRMQAVYLSDINCLFERFPFDWQLPAVAHLLDRSRLPRLMAAAGLDPSNSEAVDGVAEVVTYRPHEASVVTFPGVFSTEGRGLIAKVVREKGKMRAFHRASVALRSAISEPTVWAPETFLPRGQSRMLLMQRATGRSVYEHVVQSSSDEASAAVRLAATALLAIHATPRELAPKSRWGIRDELDHTLNRTARAQLAAPELAEEAVAVLEEVGPLIPDAKEQSVFLHGDYKGSQLLVDDGRIAVIDLDSVGRGDPAVDVGNFLADLHRAAVFGESDHPREYGRVFLATYLAGSERPGIEGRADLFRIIALVRMAIHSFRQQAHTYTDSSSFRSQLLLDEARECLAAL